MQAKKTYFLSIKNLFISAFFIVTVFLVLRTFITLSSGITLDFSVYYLAAQQILAQKSVYADVSFTLFGYPVVSGLFYLPFILFPYTTAQELFLILNGLCLGLISISIPFILLKKRSLLLSSFIFAFSYYAFPTKFTLGMGQSNLLVLFLLLLSFFLYQKKHVVPTAIVFAVACMIKPILGFLILFFILRREWRIILFVVISFSVAFWGSLLIDKQALSDYFYYLTGPVLHLSRPVGREIYYNQSLMGFVFRLTSYQMLRVWSSYLGMLLLFLTALYYSVKLKNNPISQFALLLTVLPLLDTLSWQHHFVFLIFPFIYVFISVSQLRKKTFLLVLLFIAYALVGWNFKHPEQLQLFPLSLLLSHVFYGTLLLFGMQIFTAKKLLKKTHTEETR